jgi:hypothetical protein
MSASELKYQVEKTGSNFFSRESMKFFGDTMANYGVRSATVTSNYDAAGNWSDNGESIEVWELYRRRPVKHGLKNSAYFSKADYSRIHPRA